jgi:hypothetical protein
MASMVLVWNVVTSPCLVGEKLTKRGILGTMIIITGSICATIFSQHDTPSYTLEDFGQRWSSPEVIIYEIVVISIFVSAKYGLHRMAVKYDARQFIDESSHQNDSSNEGEDEEDDDGKKETISSSDIDLEAVAKEASKNGPKHVDVESMALNYTEGSREYNIAQFVMALVAGMLVRTLTSINPVIF